MTDGSARLAADFSPAVISRQRAIVVGTVAIVGAILYVAHPPAVPDLAAQVARVNAARSGAVLWWSGWFGGVQLADYSALSPILMASIGVALAAALAALGVTALGFSLFRDARRPLAGVVFLGCAAFADVLAGRVTFALGAAAAVASIALLRRHSPIPAVATAALSFLFSPLAALFLGIGALAVAIGEPTRRRTATWVAVVLIGAGAVQMIVFPGAGQMPYPWWHMAVALVEIAVVAAVCPNRTIRIGCAIAAGATVFFFLVPSPVGTNMVRLSWLVATPMVAASGRLPRFPLVVIVLGLAVWPAIDLGIQLDKAASPASKSAFFTPMVDAWRQQAVAAGPTAAGERVELVDPASHWGAAYVAPVVPIARGWDRPTDRADNALFYDGSLTAASYDDWLHETSVGWVALPKGVGLDYASKAEAEIVASQPGYLEPVWHNASWQLYRVLGAQPVVRGADIVAVNDRQITFRTSQAGAVDVAIRWSPYLALTAGGESVDTCVANLNSWTRVEVPSAGTYTLGAHLALDTLGPRHSCPAA
jgi:hypothetical protein